MEAGVVRAAQEHYRLQGPGQGRRDRSNQRKEAMMRDDGRVRSALGAIVIVCRLGVAAPATPHDGDTMRLFGHRVSVSPSGDTATS